MFGSNLFFILSSNPLTTFLSPATRIKCWYLIFTLQKEIFKKYIYKSQINISTICVISCSHYLIPYDEAKGMVVV